MNMTSVPAANLPTLTLAEHGLFEYHHYSGVNVTHLVQISRAAAAAAAAAVVTTSTPSPVAGGADVAWLTERFLLHAGSAGVDAGVAMTTQQAPARGPYGLDRASGVHPAKRRNPHRRAYSGQQMVSKNVKEKVSFIFVMALIPCFSVFGSVGNVLSLCVLVHHRMRNATNMVLAALAASDLLVLLHALFFSFLRFYTLRNPESGERLRASTFPVLGPYSSVVTARITTGLTTMLSVERLVAVYFPMKAKVMCGRAMTATCIVLIYLVTAVMFIPSALKYHAFSKTVNNQTMHILALTSLGQNELFGLVYGNVLNVLFRLVPILVLILVNILIALAIRRTWNIRRSMSSGGSASYEQNRITLMLLMVSLVFLVCILPGAVHSIFTQIYAGHYARFGAQSNIYDVFSNVTYFLETVNSSVNFVIYMAFSTKFCRTYKQMFCCRQRHLQSPRASARSVIRFSTRPQNGSRSSMTSYRELYYLNHLGKGNSPNSKLVEGTAVTNGNPGRKKSGLVVAAGAIAEEGGVRFYRTKQSVSDSQSGHSHSHSHSPHSSIYGVGERASENSVHSAEREPTAEDMYS